MEEIQIFTNDEFGKGALNHRYLTNGGEQEIKVIPEGDIYRLIIRSNLPSRD